MDASIGLARRIRGPILPGLAYNGGPTYLPSQHRGRQPTMKIDLLDPNEGATTANFGAGAARTLTAWPATSSGKFHFRIGSADGSIRAE